jgi:cytidylate kinase
MHKFIVAIDGGSGTGKSTVSKLLAKELDLNYIDTGAIYRTLAYKINEENIELNDEYKIDNLCTRLVNNYNFIDGKVFLGKEELTSFIRTQNISMLASKVSAIEIVRKRLLDIQRKLAINTNKKGSIVDGRDMGTVVFPNASIKIFLTASDNVRAKRRFDELIEKGEKVDFGKILEETIRRDKQDSERSIAPLKKANDAIEINTDNLNIEEVKNKIKGIILEKL